MKKSSFAVAVGIVVLACASRGLAQTASLIDIAKAEEARRKAIAAPAKVITNIDLRPAVVGAPADTSPAVPAGDRPAESAPAVPSTPAAGAPPASATAESEQQNPASEQPKPPAEQPKPPTEQPKSPAEQQKAAEKATPSEEAQGESHWRQRIGDARTKLEQDKIHIDALVSQVNALTGAVHYNDDPGQKQALANQRQKVQFELDRLKKQAQDDTKAVADVQEEARRAGVPPGWLR